MKNFLKFIFEFVTFIGLFILAVLIFITLNIAIDINNPCSNFSDVQDQCEQK